jgi:hypothetical protein
MNITEANHLNNLLRFVLNGTDGRTQDGTGAVTSQSARESAEYLADRANKALGAGWRGETLRLAWPGNRVDWGEEEVRYLTGLDDEDGIDDDMLRIIYGGTPPPAELNAQGEAALGGKPGERPGPHDSRYGRTVPS